MEFDYADILNFSHINSSEMLNEMEGQSKVFYWSLYVTVLLIGVGGNSFVCISVARKRSMRTPVNIILANLAIADILMCLFSFILGPMQEVGGHIFIHATCHLSVFAIVFSELFMTITIGLPLVICSFYQQTSVNKIFGIVLAHWFVALIYAIVPTYNAELEIIHDDNVLCNGFNMNSNLNNFYDIVNSILKIFYPLFTTVCCLIFKNQITNNSLCKLLLLSVIIFFLLWTPYTVLPLYARILNTYFESLMLFYNITLLSVVYKPILYVSLDENFNNEFKEMFHIKRRRADFYGLNNINI